MAPISVPPSLKRIKVFLTRASELDRTAAKDPESRVVAYNCRQYAVLTGIPIAGTGADPAAKACLGDLLGVLEQEKGAMSVFSKDEHWKICRKVADKVFDKADGEDRGGVANKGTAKGFYAAGTFYEILQQFHNSKTDEESDEINNNEGSNDDEYKAQMEEEEQRRLYCKWKATEILNAIKEGRTPTPGGYQQQEQLDEEEDAQNHVQGAGGGGQDDLPLPPSIPEEEMASSSYQPEEKDSLPLLPPPPSMPTSDFYSAQQPTSNNHPPPPPAYNGGGIELNLNGDATPTVVEEVDEGDEDSGTEEIFIPGAVKNAADEITTNNDLFVEDNGAPAPSPPPPYSDHMSSAIPPPIVANKSLPPPNAAAAATTTTAASDSNNNQNTSGMFSSFFGNNKSSKKKLSRAEMADAVELTKFALSALQKGDGDLGRERLEQALGVWTMK